MCRARIYPQGATQWSSSYQSCIEACNTCADACDYCSIACLQEDDVKMMAECIRLALDCAAICRLAAAYRPASMRGTSVMCVRISARPAARSARGIRRRTAKTARRRAAVAQRSVAGCRVQLRQNHDARAGPSYDVPLMVRARAVSDTDCVRIP